jgi:hypothetical protein
MHYDTLDSVLLAVLDLKAASQPYERLGLGLSPAHAGRRTISCGGPASPFSVHFLADEGPDGPLAGPLRQALAAGGGLFAVTLRVPSLDLAASPDGTSPQRH